jgi:hypothetical protein
LMVRAEDLARSMVVAIKTNIPSRHAL